MRSRRALARVLIARLAVRIPSVLVRGMTGEMATLFLDGQHVRPAKALAAGFRFEHGRLDDALEDLLRPSGSRSIRLARSGS